MGLQKTKKGTTGEPSSGAQHRPRGDSDLHFFFHTAEPRHIGLVEGRPHAALP